jgi:hypothetical protein
MPYLKAAAFGVLELTVNSNALSLCRALLLLLLLLPPLLSFCHSVRWILQARHQRW